MVKQEPQKKGMPKAAKWILGVVAVVAVLAIFCVSFVFSSTYFHKNAVALTVGEHEISPAEFNYYFREAYYSISQDSGDASSYLSYMTDYIKEEAVLTATNVYATYDAAIADGYALNEEELAAVDQEIAELTDTAKAMGAPNANQLLASVYGKGCDTKNYRKFREMYTLCARYTADKTESQDTSAAALDAYYAENADDLDTVSYRQFFLPLQGSMEETKALAETVLTAVKADAAAMDSYALEYATENNREHYETTKNPTLLQRINKASATTEVADWLFDAARKDGDTTYFENSDATGLYLVRFGSRDTGDYNTVNVRHILVSVSDATDADAKKVAQEKAQSYLEEFQNGDKSEESFAALATAYSEDNAEDGGLYENVYMGQMVNAFEEWCFDAARKVGDSGIVETEYGYHVMYFAGEGETYRNLNTKNEILSNFYENWVEELTANYEVVQDEFGMGFVNTTTESGYSY